MARRRNNPWPGLADLFSALLIVTFAALVLVAQDHQRLETTLDDLTDRLDDKEGDIGAVIDELVEEREALLGQLAKARSERDSALKVADLLQQRLDNLNSAYETLQRQIKDLEEQQGRGIDRPPCLMDGTQVVPLVEVTIFDDGIRVRRFPTPRHEAMLKNIPNLDSLTDGRLMRGPEFLDEAKPVFQWARDPNNDLGFECVFYFRARIETDSKEALSTWIAFVDDRFYLSNHADVDRFLKRR